MTIDFTKTDNGLVPVIIQDATTKTVLMLGYMNQEAFKQTETSGKVTFYSRSKQRLWTKGEESGNFLQVVSIKNDCDKDTLLIQVNPQGPTCHTGSDTCWNEENTSDYGFITELENVIEQRKLQSQKITEEKDTSYVSSLFKKGMNKIAQKVGEEAVEVVIEAKDNNDDLFLNESADLLFHYLILLQAKDYKITDVVRILKSRV
ncbi:bifunctional phosphoribosyl-AMP cyclohydrolase/phosphoribosyl-ATP diphosphatase HisIE [Aquimarina sp. ERC-38]|uniref:bifunctional phosphoribosyl-AMP cyclohydrolase/phosphoribosyl-ATP diphosphatase HisIE n=1 Tax=Aquimarina sp. ERC-38 TaxID=2949996 RepID=UPI0022472B79|nr:bifunctional phosphoribosyl-AMP cyclohydrolase/phosphoribosyl-ATP diphosphatase HisIE [Aquimarina sp. ERC-38]UZO80276.1 bifunctional phosphoribosyl-AMP cyclohydrolase/phosphoribosyl-ATP diphosphatase HisIE [Aquimarina sp. ERC-38]